MTSNTYFDNERYGWWSGGKFFPYELWGNGPFFHDHVKADK